MIGRVFGGHRIVRELSSGGQGTIYEAEHELLKRTAAVKLLRPELSENSDLVQRFFNEAKAASAIRHPGIIEIYDFGYTPDGIAYLVMELLAGEPLSRRIERGRLPEADAVPIARGIATALAAAHDKGIVHRDLKPDNVFLVPDPEAPAGVRPKVLDFGVAKLGDQLPRELRHTVTGALMGTPLYMAPEQARAAGHIDHRADLYSLGCIVYEMLVGRPPFVAQGAGEIIALHLFSEPEPPAASPEVQAIVMRLLAKEPGDRFARASDVADALAPRAPATGVRRVAPVPLPTLEVAAQAPRSRLPLVAGALTVAVAAAAVLLVSRSGGHTAAPPPPVAAPPAPQPAPPASPPKSDEPIVEQLPATPPPPHKPKVTKPAKGPTTANGSPYEPDL